ncbi:MAG: RRXRR domain-containing protein [Microcystaceae cyanobacterium]
MPRVPVVSQNGLPLMPTKPSRARRWIKEGKAVGKFNDLNQFYVQLTKPSLDTKNQPISIGIDPGKLFSGIGVQSSQYSLWTGHLELPFKTVKKRMADRKMMRRGRRGRRINRQLPFHLRAHRQKRFDNRRGKKLPPSIRANRQLELRVVKELCQVFPVTDIYFEYVKADVDLKSKRQKARSGKGFSPIMVGQKWMLEQLKAFAEVHTRYGWQTSNLRQHLGLEKSKDKAEKSKRSHANDGLTLACFRFLDYRYFQSVNSHGHHWVGEVEPTDCPFRVVKRPPYSRRQLHLMLPSKGGLRRKYGGTTTDFDLRKGDWVDSPKGMGYVSGQTKRQISVSDANWKRLGQIVVSKVTLIRRCNGLIVTC